MPPEVAQTATVTSFDVLASPHDSSRWRAALVVRLAEGPNAGKFCVLTGEQQSSSWVGTTPPWPAGAEVWSPGCSALTVANFLPVPAAAWTLIQPMFSRRDGAVVQANRQLAVFDARAPGWVRTPTNAPSATAERAAPGHAEAKPVTEMKPVDRYGGGDDAFLRRKRVGERLGTSGLRTEIRFEVLDADFSPPARLEVLASGEMHPFITTDVTRRDRMAVVVGVVGAAVTGTFVLIDAASGRRLASSNARPPGVPPGLAGERVFHNPTAATPGGKWWGIRMVTPPGLAHKRIIVARFGPVNASGQERRVASNLTPADAEVQMAQTIRTKLGDGYVEVTYARS